MQDVGNLTQTIGAKAPVQPPSLVAALQSFITNSSAPNVPQAILQAPSGQLVSAVVLATNPKGQVFLQTPQGQVAFTSPVELKVGQQLVLETLPRQPLPQRVPGSPPPPPASLPLDVKLVRVNGVSAETLFPEAAQSATNTQDAEARGQIQAALGGVVLRALQPQRSAAATQQDAAKSQSIFEEDAVSLIPSALQSKTPFRANVLQAPQSAALLAPEGDGVEALAEILPSTVGQQAADPDVVEAEGEATLPPHLRALKPGDNLLVRITGGNLVTHPDAPESRVPIQFNFSAAAAVSVSQQQQETPELLPQSLQPTATAEEGTVSEQQQEVDAALPLKAPDKNLLKGVVIAQEKSGAAIVHTAAGTLRLPAELPFLKGSELQLQVLDVEVAPDVFAASQLPLSFQTGNAATDALIKGNSSLDALFKQLFQASPEAGEEATRAFLPQPGRQLGAKILDFIKAVQQENVAENIEQHVPKDIAEKLALNRVTQEFSSLKQAMAEAPAQQWSFLLVPVAKGEEMQHMRWFKRRQEAEDNSGREGTRFVVELETESLGSLQLDGLFFNQPQAKQFDLVVRSTNGFSEEEQLHIAEIYNNYGEISGYRGAIRFEQAKTFPIQPLRELVEQKNRQISA